MFVRVLRLQVSTVDIAVCSDKRLAVRPSLSMSRNSLCVKCSKNIHICTTSIISADDVSLFHWLQGFAMCKLQGYNVFGKQIDRIIVSWLNESVNCIPLLQFHGGYTLYMSKSNLTVHGFLTSTVMSIMIKRSNDCEHWFPLVSH